MGGTLHDNKRYNAQGLYRTLKIGDIIGGNYVEIDKDGQLSFNGTAGISDDSDQTDSFINLSVSKNFSMGVFGDGTGVNITDSNLAAAQLFPELKSTGDALTAGNVAYGIRNRFLVNKAQTNNVSLYATQGQLRVKANLAAGVHSGLFGYVEQSGTVTLSSSGAFNSACNLAIETDASLTLNSGVNLEGLTITSLINTGGTLNGNINGIHLRAETSKQPWTNGIYIQNSTIGIKFDNAATQRAIDIQITPTTADRQLYMDINYDAAKEAAYIIGSSTVTSGEVTALRARGQAKAVGASTAEIRGVHAQGIAFEALYAGTVNALYAEAIAKGTSTVTTIRGAMIACDSENTPTSIGTMIGAHIRVKTSVAPGTAFIGTIVETEKFGSGVIANALLDLRSTTWGAGEESVVTLIDMSNFGSKASHSHIRFPIAAALDGDSTTEGDFWYDSSGHVFKYRDNAGTKTITAA